MAHGPLWRARFNARHGAKYNGVLTLADGGAPPITVPKDGPFSAIYVPRDAADFAQLSLPAPNSLWRCQEAGGNLADSIGSLTLTANGSPLYNQAVPSWTRTAAAFNQTAAQRFAAAGGVGPNPAVTSVAWLFYMVMDTAPGGLRGVLNIGGNVAVGLLNTGAQPLRLSVNGVTVDDVTTDPVADNAVHPIMIVHDIVATTTTLYTNEAATPGTFAAATDGTKGIGAGVFSASPPALSGALWGAMWSGAAAQMNTAAVRTLLQGLGWTIPW